MPNICTGSVSLEEKLKVFPVFTRKNVLIESSRAKTFKK